ncbi:MAG: alpha/beta hydrolase [Bacteroidota bacterium]
MERRWTLGVLCLSLLLSGCDRYRQWNSASSDESLLERFADHPVQPTVHRYQVGDRTIRYLSIGADSLPTTLLIHGAPSSLTSWMRYLKDTTITRHTRLVAVDRPGYGGSGFGVAEPSVAKQSALLKPLLDSLAGAPQLMVVGSSYGGTLTTRLAMDYPERISRIMLISASVAPGQEKIYKASYFIKLPGLKQLTPTMITMANVEKLNHYEQLKAMEPLWDHIDVPVTILHGNRDDLIYYDNALFAQAMLSQSPQVELVTVSKADHGLPWSHPELVKEKLLAPWVVQGAEPVVTPSASAHE